jgi:chemotaxis protein CheD
MPTFYDDFGSYEKSELPLDDSAIEIFLDPGEYFVGDSGFTVRTLLGSCVSITLWHPHFKYGAMSHFLLSTRPKGNTLTQDRRQPSPELDGKYADEVLLLMLRQLKDANVKPEQCQAKIFGGGNMFPQRRQDDSTNIGKKNGETARMLLRSHGIPIVSEDLYGNGHREIIFNVSNGDVWIRQIKLHPSTTIG